MGSITQDSPVTRLKIVNAAQCRTRAFENFQEIHAENVNIAERRTSSFRELSNNTPRDC